MRPRVSVWGQDDNTFTKSLKPRRHWHSRRTIRNAGEGGNFCQSPIFITAFGDQFSPITTRIDLTFSF